jgi:hypothetical protein
MLQACWGRRQVVPPVADVALHSDSASFPNGHLSTASNIILHPRAVAELSHQPHLLNRQSSSPADMTATILMWHIMPTRHISADVAGVVLPWHIVLTYCADIKHLYVMC